MEALRDIGEFGLIHRVTGALPGAPGLLLGIGDDCAVVQGEGGPWLLSCDASIEGVHFRRGTAAAWDIGWKAAASALSDIAAMGGAPRFMLIAAALPPDTPVAYAEELFQGLLAAGQAVGAVIAGGDTTRSPGNLFLDVTVIGQAVNGRYLGRAGARPGDLLAVTGMPGQSAGGLRALEAGLEAPALVAAHRHPIPRIMEGQWLAGGGAVHAMIDVSDGLLQDAGHLAEASGLGVEIVPERVPVSAALRDFAAALGEDPLRYALGGGEDYELAVAVAAGDGPALCAAFQAQFGRSLTPVGQFTEAWAGVRVAGAVPGTRGFDHFRK